MQLRGTLSRTRPRMRQGTHARHEANGVKPAEVRIRDVKKRTSSRKNKMGQLLEAEAIVLVRT